MLQVKNSYASEAVSLLSTFTLIVLMVTLCLSPVANATESQIQVYYFYAEDCSHCNEITVLIAELEDKYPGFSVSRFVISGNSTNSELFNSLILAYNPPAVDIPAVFIGNKSIIGYGLTKETLEEAIVFCMQNKCPDPLSIMYREDEQQSPLLPLLIGTALIEGINPCGFAVLIVLLASLLLVKTKRNVIIVGLVFIASVFVTHFIVGFGIMGWYRFSDMTSIIRNAVIVIVISAGLLNIHDFLRDKATLAIPSSLKQGIVKLARYASIPGAVALGFFSSIVGLPCTGAIYLTTLKLIADTPSETAYYLLLYNFFYVLPLFAIVTIVYTGASLEDVDAWRKGKRRYIRLIGGLVMLAIGIAMLFGLV